MNLHALRNFAAGRELIGFLRDDKVQVRLYERGFLHAKAYLFHRDRIGPPNQSDRLRPFAAVVGSSNFTGPGLASNRELNLGHRVFTRVRSADRTGASENEISMELRLGMESWKLAGDAPSPAVAFQNRSFDGILRNRLSS